MHENSEYQHYSTCSYSSYQPISAEKVSDESRSPTKEAQRSSREPGGKVRNSEEQVDNRASGELHQFSMS